MSRTALGIRHVSYGKLGHFRSDESVVLNTLPESPAQIGTKFALLTRGDKVRSSLSYEDSSSLDIVTSEPIAFVIHGFGEPSKALSTLQVALLEVVPQVVTVDWTRGSRFPMYDQATANSQLVGRQVAILVEQLRHHRNLEPRNVHLIGHSLGAHVCGFAGRRLREEHGQLVGRISAIDAAGPKFEGTRFVLSSNDASFVDAIHTNGKSWTFQGLGLFKAFAHADFYPNGGVRQPQCDKDDLTCHHEAGIQYYTDSILQKDINKFEAKLWLSVEEAIRGTFRVGDEVNQMGYFATKPAESSIYYLAIPKEC